MCFVIAVLSFVFRRSFRSRYDVLVGGHQIDYDRASNGGSDKCGGIQLDSPVMSRHGRAPFRRLKTSLSQGAEWKALISKYIGTIPLSGDACAAEQSISGVPPLRTPVSSAIIAKLGAAERHSQWAAPRAAALRLSSWIAQPSDPPE
jgi:hypothetical protein